MVNKNKITELIECFSVKCIETEMILYFLDQIKIDYSKSLIILEYLKEHVKNKDLYIKIKELGITHDIKTLENCLELLIPNKDRELNGAFFTPTYIVDYIIEEINPKETDRSVDLSCGCGAFLIGLVDFHRKKHNKTIKQTVKENIFGADILDYNISRTKLLLTLYALQYNEILDNADFNLYTIDSLRHNWNSHFDNVVGNPPYVKFQDLSEDNRIFLLDNFETINKGTFNLYFAFFELGYKLLGKNGKLGYITPNNFFTSLAGEPLRAFFLREKCVNKIIDFSSKKVFSVQTYTAISFLIKKENKNILYDRISNTQIPELFLENTDYSENPITILDAKKWRLLKSDERKNIESIENIGTPIKEIFDICVGIATLKDSVFFVDEANMVDDYIIKKGSDGKKYKIEKNITRSVYKISDFKNQEDIATNTRRIIFPYKVNGSAVLIDEETLKSKYPYCYEYLLSEKDILSTRDKGKLKSSQFYAWGRTQGLTRSGKRILNPTFSQYPRFLLVENEESFFTNGYGIFFKNIDEMSLFPENVHILSKIENIDIVQKILNSNIMHYYISRTSVSIDGGYPCYQKNFIEKFTIPNFSVRELDELRVLISLSDINTFLEDKYKVNLSELKK